MIITQSKIKDDILQSEINEAIDRFLDYSYLLNEGRQINEFNIKDAAKKANDLISFAIKKTGDAANDASLRIYVSATEKIKNIVGKLMSKETDKKKGLILRIISKIINFVIKNPKLAFASVRVGLMIVSLLGSSVLAYEQSNNSDAFNDVFEKLGIDIDGSNVGNANNLADQIEQLEKLNNLNDQELGSRLNQAVSDMGIDVDSHEFMTPDQAHDDTLAPTDLMNDPAYADYQTAIEQIRSIKGDDTVRRLINLAKLDRVLEEQHYKGMDVSANTQLKTHSIDAIKQVIGTDGEITGTAQLDSSNRLIISNIEIKYNGVTVSKLQQVGYSVNRDGQSFSITKQNVTGLTVDIDNRVKQLTQGVDNKVVDQIFKGMHKFSDYGKVGDVWKKNESYQRMMILAGIINEEGMIQKGMNVVKKGIGAVKKFATDAKNAAQNFLSNLTNKLSQFSSSVGAIFTVPENMNQLADRKLHTFYVKNGQIKIDYGFDE